MPSAQPTSRASHQSAVYPLRHPQGVYQRRRDGDRGRGRHGGYRECDGLLCVRIPATAGCLQRRSSVPVPDPRHAVGKRSVHGRGRQSVDDERRLLPRPGRPQRTTWNAALDHFDAGHPANSGSVYTYQVTTNPSPSQEVTFSLGSPPAGMNINASTGLIAWTPSVFQTGPNTVTVLATDQSGDAGQQTFSISVSGEIILGGPFSSPKWDHVIVGPVDDGMI